MSVRAVLMIVLVIASSAMSGCGGGSGENGDDGGASASDSAATGSGDTSGDDGGDSDDSGDNVSAVVDGTTHLVTDVTVQNYGEDSDSGRADVTFGQVFADGDVGAKQQVVAMLDGKALPTQLDRKATWSDGSLRHGVITVQLDKPAAGKSRRLKLYAVAGDVDLGVGAVSLSELLGSDFTAQVKIKLNGETYTADARDALSQIAQNGSCPAWGDIACKRWLKGGLASEWIVPAALVHGSSTAPRLRVFFNIRAYRAADGSIANVRVDSVIENDLAYDVSPSNVQYDAEIDVGNQRYTADDITHYVQARWHHVLWSNAAPEIYVQPDIAYLQNSRAISKYADVSPTEKFLDGLAQSADPMTHASQQPDMGATGAQAGIGPLPQWTTEYVLSGDRRAYNWMRVNDGAAGSYSFHYRDGETGRPLQITNHPYVTIADISHARSAGGQYEADLLPSCGGSCAHKYFFEIAHQPSVGYVSYLVTGDFYYLEELQFEASYDELWANPSYRDFDKGRLLKASPQVRGQAWELRTISNAAFATPDADPLKSYFVDQIDYIIQDYLKSYVDDSGHPLHTLDSYGAIHYPAGSTNTEIAPWQADFFTWAVGHAAEQGVPGAKRLLDWLADFQVGLMTSAGNGGTTGFCWLQASGYTFKVRDTNDSPVYSSLDEVYSKTYPRLAGLKCNSQEMVNTISASGDDREIGEMSGYPTSPTGFPANFQIGLAAAVDSGIDDGGKAWQIFANRTDQPDYSNDANFAVVPRSAQ